MTTFHRVNVRSFAKYISFSFAIATCGLTLSSGQTPNNTRLSRLDLLSQGVRTHSQSTASLAQEVILGAYDPDLAGNSSLASELSSAQDGFMSGRNVNLLTDSSVAEAFDSWRTLVKDPNTVKTAPMAVHILRASLSTVAPNLITSDTNGLPANQLSPAEAVYLFDFLVAHGAVPQLTRRLPQIDTTEYNDAVTFYTTATSAGQRQYDVMKIVRTFFFE